MSDLETATLRAALYRILPSEHGPGAREADAPGFVAWLVEQPFFRPRLSSFQAGLDLLESTALAEYGVSFGAAPAWMQDAVLLRLQRMPHQTVRRFFVTLVRVTVTGFLCPPQYHGNRDSVGWAYIGYSPSPGRQ